MQEAGILTHSPALHRAEDPAGGSGHRPGAVRGHDVPRASALITITAAGFASSIGQITIVRELLVLFYGNELSAGLVFAGWLLWNATGSALAGRWGKEGRAPRPGSLAAGISLLAVLLPVTILWIRAARIIWAIPAGELVPLGKMLWVTLSATGSFCLVSGALFALTWAMQAEASGANEGSHRPILVYLGEAAGAAVGGLFFYFILLRYLPVLAGALVVSAILATAAAFLLRPWRRIASNLHAGRALFACLCLLSVISLAGFPAIENQSRRWQWGPNVLTVEDTPYHNLAIIESENLFTFFASGLWLFSAPDRQTAEPDAHLAMLQHPHPRSVLLIGGGIGGTVAEILEHPTVTRVDYVEPDPEVIRLGRELLPAEATAPLDDTRVRMHHEDAGAFLRRRPGTYDVVIMHPGDPMNAQTNRFYTVEFYRRLSGLLNPDGIVSLAVSTPTNLLGPAQARFLRSIDVTLRRVFPQVCIYPGDSARFFAGGPGARLVLDPSELISRMEKRNLQLQYVRPDTLFDSLSPFRLHYITSVMEQERPAGINRDFKPTCYFNSLLLWGAQLHPVIHRTLMELAGIGRGRFWAGMAAAVLAMTAFFWLGRPRPAGAAAASVTVVGGTLIVLEIALLLGFQVLAGFFYTQLAVIISFFMAGMALGAAAFACISNRLTRPLRWLVLVQTVLSIHLIGTMGALLVLQHQMQNGCPMVPIIWIFAGLAVTAGALGGLHFALAVRLVSGPAPPSGRIGGTLYALDLTGAAASALAASLFLLPLYGLPTTLLVFSILNVGSILALLRPAVLLRLAFP